MKRASSRIASSSNSSSSPNKKVKIENDSEVSLNLKLDSSVATEIKPKPEVDDELDVKPTTAVTAGPSTPSKASATLTKKLKALSTAATSPFPTHARPTAQECVVVNDLLSALHGQQSRPAELLDEAVTAGCGETSSTLDALVRTILSQNTTSKNSTNAKLAMDATYGRANYEAVLASTDDVLAETIKSGGLAKVKAKVIRKILTRLQETRGELNMDYLSTMTDAEVMKELVSFDGVGPKTASCVMLFNLSRDSFAVDTHVFRITKSLGWTPASATRDTAFAHLDLRVPGELKYSLHKLLVSHGRSCERCAAGSTSNTPVIQASECPLRNITSLTTPKPKKGKK